MIVLDSNRRLRKLRKLAEQHSDNLESARIQDSITNSIGDRRERDLLDQISEIEKSWGWDRVVEILVSAQVAEYSTPMTLGFQRKKLEPLKFREMLFGLFSYSGFEPLNVSTEEILRRLREGQSFVEANSLFQSLIEEHIVEQIESGDLLFFSGGSCIPQLGNRIRSLQEDQLDNLALVDMKGRAHLGNLWKRELGRRVLADLGVEGDTVDIEGDVIQILRASFPQIVIGQKKDGLDSQLPAMPSLPIYNRLLKAIIQHDVDALQEIGSQWAYPVLDYYVSESLKQYLEDGSPEKYREYLDGLNAHIAVRAMESISTLQKLIERNEIPRISAPAALALGNFSTKSAISILIERVCSASDETSDAALKSLERIHNLTPEAEPMIRIATETSCYSAAKLRGILEKRTWKVR